MAQQFDIIAATGCPTGIAPVSYTHLDVYKRQGQTYLMTAPWMMIMPGLAILTTVLAFTLLGDGLRDALDVKMKDA